MIRRGQHKKRKTRKARESARRELASEQGRYEPVPRSLCEEVAWAYPGNARYTIQVVRRVWYLRGAITEFAASVQVLTAQGWKEVERIDCRHGHTHLHDHRGRVVHLHRLDNGEDVERSHNRIEEILEERLRILSFREDR